jgi:hypothetical protein
VYNAPASRPHRTGRAIRIVLAVALDVPPAGNSLSGIGKMLPASLKLCRRPQYRAGTRNMVLAPVVIIITSSGGEGRRVVERRLDRHGWPWSAGPTVIPRAAVLQRAIP